MIIKKKEVEENFCFKEISLWSNLNCALFRKSLDNCQTSLQSLLSYELCLFFLNEMTVNLFGRNDKLNIKSHMENIGSELLLPF